MQIGRVVFINYGADYGKLAVIIDVVDQNRALIDGPEPLTGVSRKQIPLKRLSLTPITIKIGRNAGQKALMKAFKEADVETQWNETAFAKRLTQQRKRASLSDFDRFKVMMLRKKRSQLVTKQLAAMA